MKNPNKIYLILLALTTFSFNAKAQNNIAASSSTISSGVIYSVGVETGISSGNFNTAIRVDGGILKGLH